MYVSVQVSYIQGYILGETRKALEAIKPFENTIRRLINEKVFSDLIERGINVVEDHEQVVTLTNLYFDAFLEGYISRILSRNQENVC